MKSSHEGPSEKRRKEKKKVYDGHPIAILRTIRSLTQQELADAAGMTTREVGRFERGESIPTEDQLLQLTDGLRLPMFLVDSLREIVSHVERFAPEPGSSHWSGRIKATGPQPEIVRESESSDSELTRKRNKRLKKAGIVFRIQSSTSEFAWELLRDSDDPEW